MPFMLFVKPGCKYSVKAKRDLRNRGKSFTSVTCKDVDELKTKLRARGLRIPSTLTFPRVYEGTRLIGGSDDLVKYLSK